jgi:hypothetical protein
MAATPPLLASTVSLGTLTPFTGGDAGEGLDLSGNIIYAFNLGPGATQTVQGVTFAAAPVGGPPAGITTTTSTQFDYSTANAGGANGADYGATADDDSLETIVNTVWYGANWTFDLAVTPGTQYQLQLILQESHFGNQGISNRNFDVSVETASPSNLTLAVDELVLGMETDGAAPAQPGADQGLVYTYTFTATDSSFQVALDDSPAGSDTFCVLGAVTLEQMAAITNPVVALDGSTTGDSIAGNAPPGTQVGNLSMIGTNPVGFAYALNSGGDTNFFNIPAGTSNLVVKAALGAGPYALKIEGTKGGFSVTNDFTITIDSDVTVSLDNNVIFHEASVGTTVGSLSMANVASQAGFAYSLHPSGDTTNFDIPAGTSDLLTDAALSVGSYDIVVLSTNANDGFWVTNGLTITAVSDFDDFSTDPNIATEWTEYGYFTADGGTPTWDSGDEDLDLLKAAGQSGLGLYRTGVTRAATDPVTMTVKALSRTSGTWGFLGLMISAVPQPGYITTTDDTYTLRMNTISETTNRFEVTRTYQDGTGDYILNQSADEAFSGPYVLEIVPVGTNYVFKVNGTPLYTSGTAAGDTYDTTAKDSLIYYEIVVAGDGVITATVDDFGVSIGTNVAVTLDGSTIAGSIVSNAPVGTLVGALSMVNTNPAGFAYSLDAGGDTTHFDIAGGTSNLVTKAALGAGPYAVKIVGAKGGFSVTNDFAITVAPPITVSLSNTNMTANAPVGALVGTLSMANAVSQDDFAYALDPSGDTTSFAISDTNRLLTAATLAAGSYDIVIKGTNATDGFWVTNGFTIAVAVPDPLPEPVQYWLFDDGSGTNAANLVTNGNTGTLVNSPAWITSGLEPKLTSRTDYPSTAALDFETDGTNYVNGGDINLSTSNGTGEATVSMWVCPESLSTDQRLIAWVSAGGDGDGTLRLENGSLEVFQAGVAWHPLAPASPLSAGTWYHLAFVWTGNSVQAYVDGVAQSSATADFDFAGGDFGIGARFRDSFGFTFDGKIDDVAIFDVALNQGQITALAAGDAAIAGPAPIGTVIVIK